MDINEPKKKTKTTIICMKINPPKNQNQCFSRPNVFFCAERISKHFLVHRATFYSAQFSAA